MLRFFIHVSLLLLPVLLSAQGSLLLVGGGREDKHSWSDQPYGWFVQQADSGTIVNIDVSPKPSDWYPKYFEWLGADTSSRPLWIPNRASANDSSTYRILSEADGIFIEGGDQWRYVETWKRTLVEDAIHAVFQKGGAIGGTSAGLAVLGDVAFDAKFGTVYPDHAAYDPYHEDIHFEDNFLEILPGVLTDSHFLERGRLGRLVPMLARRIQDHGETGLLGIGVDGQSAFCIDPQHRGTAYGRAVTILSRSEESQIACEKDIPVLFTDVQFTQLLEGATYDINSQELVDSGSYMNSVTPSSWEGAFPDTTITGDAAETGTLGEIEVGRIYTETDAWRSGRLTLVDGLGRVPGTVIMPHLWQLDPDQGDDYFPNRLTGPMYAMAANPGLTALYLDSASSIEIQGNGILETEGVGYILETESVTHTGLNSGNIPGLVHARLHFLREGIRYNFREHRIVRVEEGENHLPGEIRLGQNYPNPFNDSTRIRFFLPRTGPMILSVFDLKGRWVELLLKGVLASGWHSVAWEAGDLASGLYVMQLRTQESSLVSKAMLIR